MPDPLDAYTLDGQSVKRIDDVVRRVEREGYGRGGGTPSTGRREVETIWARITDADASDPVNYSWVEVYQDSDDDWHEVDGGRSGTDTDQPANAIAAGLTYTADPTTGDVVLLRRRRVQDTGDDSWSPGWVIVSPAGPHESALIKITGTLGTGGQYSGERYNVGDCTADGAGNFLPPEGLTVESESCLVLNQDEAGQPTHWVGTDTYAVGWRLPGLSTEETPRPIYAITRGQYAGASPPGDFYESISGLGGFGDGGSSFGQFGTDNGTGWEARNIGLSLAATTITGPVSLPVLAGIFDRRGTDSKIYFKFRILSFETDGRAGFVGEGFDIALTFP